MKAGDKAPEFEAINAAGETVELSKLLTDGPIVLFFYPAAFTPGCTRESCHFRDLNAEFSSLGAQLVGISADSVDKQSRFANTYGFEFPLLSDGGSKIARRFGVSRPGFLPNSRTTFVIDTDGQVLDVIHSEFNMNVHADRALAALRSRPGAS